MRLAIVLVVLGISLDACAPYVTSYVHLEAPNVTYLNEMCRAVGPPVTVVYERGGVRFEVSLEPGYSSRSKAASLKLRAPAETVISVPEPYAYIRREGQDTRVVLEMREMARRPNGLVDYRFEFVDLPPITSSGELQLPVIDAGGVALASPVLKFERRSYAGVIPFNC